MPPVPASVTEYVVPTATDCWAAVRLVIAGAGGTVIVAVPVLVVSATEVAVIVIVCKELVASGAVNVAEVVVVFDRLPALVLQVTPAEFRSLVTAAVRVVVSVPSTLVAVAVAVTGPTDEEPPQPVVDNIENNNAGIPRHNSARIPQRISPSELWKFWQDDYRKRAAIVNGTEVYLLHPDAISLPFAPD
jgi:hypothetical protein